MFDPVNIQSFLSSVLSILRWVSLALVLLNYRAFPLVWHCTSRPSIHWNQSLTFHHSEGFLDCNPYPCQYGIHLVLPPLAKRIFSQNFTLGRESFRARRRLQNECGLLGLRF